MFTGVDTHKCFTSCLLLLKIYLLIVFYSDHVTYYLYLNCLLFNVVCLQIIVRQQVFTNRQRYRPSVVPCPAVNLCRVVRCLSVAGGGRSERERFMFQTKSKWGNPRSPF